MATVTPNYSWPVPTSTDLVKDGATAIEALGDAIDATVFGLGGSGLTLISSTTIGSGVSTVSVNDCFSATYSNYRVVMDVGAFSDNSQNLQMRMRVSGSDNSSSNYKYTALNSQTGSPFNDGLSSTGTTQWVFHRYTRSDGVFFVVDFFKPFATDYTSAKSSGISLNYNAADGSEAYLSMTVTTSYTGFTLFPTAGNMTGGTIKVYGYKD